MSRPVMTEPGDRVVRFPPGFPSGVSGMGLTVRAILGCRVSLSAWIYLWGRRYMPMTHLLPRPGPGCYGCRGDTAGSDLNGFPVPVERPLKQALTE